MTRLDTTAATILRLTQDWRDPLAWLPSLAVYVTSASEDADVCLCLDARDPGFSADVVRDMVVEAVEYLAEGRAFPDLLLVEDPIDLESIAEPVESADALVQRLGLRPRRLADDAALVIAHARWVKLLVDRLQARIDRSLTESASPARLAGEPLVTVRIPTYGDPSALISRALPSVLNGTYRNLEVLVCSDGPQPDCRAAVASVRDSRVRYLELESRPVYPDRGTAFWQTAGIHAINRMLDEAMGEVIAPLDHDDAFTADHIHALLEALRETDSDFAYGQGMMEHQDGPWSVVGSRPLRHGRVVHGAVAYTRRLSHMRYDPHSWVIDEPGDWNLWRRMKATGAGIVHVPSPLVMHFREGSSLEGRRADVATLVEDSATDVLTTSAAALLQVASAGSGSRLASAAPGFHRSGVFPKGSRTPAQRRLAILDVSFPMPLSGFRWHEAKAMLDLRRDTVVFARTPTEEHWSRPVYPLSRFAELAEPMGITDVYSVFLNASLGFLGLARTPAAGGVVGIPLDTSVAPVLEQLGIRFHTVLYPGGGLIPDTDPAVLRAVQRRAATIFSNVPEVLTTLPAAMRTAVPMATDFYALRPRERRNPFRVVFAAANNPRKGFDTVAAAFHLLGDGFHLHVVGPHEQHLHLLPPGVFTYHGWLEPAELRGVYWGADCFASPVRQEAEGAIRGEEGLIDGFPTTAAGEALASGCALISANPRPEHWMLEPDEHYLEIPPRDPDALAAAIRALAADRDRRDGLASRGAARVRDIMDVTVVAAQKLTAMGLIA